MKHNQTTRSKQPKRRIEFQGTIPIPHEVYVYGLVDPLINKVFYVGCSSYPKNRYSLHLHNARKTNTKPLRTIYFRKLIQQGVLPQLCILETVPYHHDNDYGKHNWRSREKYWTNEFRNRNHPVQNARDCKSKYSFIVHPNGRKRQRFKLCATPEEVMRRLHAGRDRYNRARLKAERERKKEVQLRAA